jgi:thiamine-phosphate pyrophosphorylase
MIARLSTLVTGRPRGIRRAPRFGLPWLWLMSDDKRLPDPAAAVRRLPPGAGVIVRARDDAARRALVERLSRIARARRSVVLVAGDWRLAARVRVDGVHVPEAMLRAADLAGLRLWRRARRAWLTASAHGRSAMRTAARARADMVLVSPVLPTPSHHGRKSLGPLHLARWAREGRVAVAALGGINAATIARLNGSGIAAIAGIGFVETG